MSVSGQASQRRNEAAHRDRDSLGGRFVCLEVVIDYHGARYSRNLANVRDISAPDAYRGELQRAAIFRLRDEHEARKQPARDSARLAFC